MASINFKEEEYEAVCSAAMDAIAQGLRRRATTLNELASKMNGSLSRAKHPAMPGFRGVPIARLDAPGPIDADLGIVRTTPTRNY